MHEECAMMDINYAKLCKIVKKSEQMWKNRHKFAYEKHKSILVCGDMRIGLPCLEISEN